MICSNCKKEIEDGSRFCEFCGTPQQAAPQNPSVDAQPSGQNMADQPLGGQSAMSGQNMGGQSSMGGQNMGGQSMGGQPMGGQSMGGGQPMMQRPPRQPMSSGVKKIIAAAAAVAVIVAVALIVVLNLKTKINLQDYVKVEFDGYDTAGTAYIKFDTDRFLEDMQESRKMKKQLKDAKDLDDIEDWSSFSDSLQSALAAYSFVDSLDWKLDKDSDLSNGDKVTVTFKYDNDKAADAGIKFIGDKAEFTVSGLQEVKEIDPMADVTVEFSGTSPDCSAKVVNNSTESVLQDVYYKIDKSYDIAKGEKVTVTIEYDSDMEAYYLQKYGCKFTSTSKEFTCDNVDEYVTKYEDIDAETLEKLKKQTTDAITAYFAGTKKSFDAGSINFEGCYFLTAKDASTWGYKNSLYVVYSSQVKGKKKGSFKKTKVFLPIKFNNILRYADGTLYVDLNATRIEGSTDLYCNWDTLRGYTKKETMLNDLVESQLSEYTYEATDALK